MRRTMVSAVPLLLACGIALAASPLLADSSPRPLSLNDLQGFGIRAGKAVDQPPASPPPAAAPTVITIAPTLKATEATVRPQPRPSPLRPVSRPATAQSATLSTGELQAIALIPAVRPAPSAAAPAAVEPPPRAVPIAKPAHTEIEAAAPEPPPPPPVQPVRLGADGLVAVGLGNR